MTPELHWLALTALVTAIMWVPYIFNLISVRGLLDAMGYPDNPKPMSGWAQRLKYAHYNAIENLVVFSVFVLIAHSAGIHSKLTVLTCMVYFWSRLLYAIVYAARIPIVRTLIFAVSWICILIMAGSVIL